MLRRWTLAWLWGTYQPQGSVHKLDGVAREREGQLGCVPVRRLHVSPGGLAVPARPAARSSAG